MQQPYSVLADWLSKFHTWPESIQALWLVAMQVTVLGVTWIVMRGLRDTVAAWRGRGEGALYGVSREWHGPALTYQGGRPRVAEGGAPLPKLTPHPISLTASPPSLLGRSAGPNPEPIDTAFQEVAASVPPRSAPSAAMGSGLRYAARYDEIAHTVMPGPWPASTPSLCDVGRRGWPGQTGP